MKRLLIGGVVAVLALSVVAYAFASGGGDDSTSNDRRDDLVQVDPTPDGGVVIDLPTGTPGDSPAGGTRPAGSNEHFGPAGEPATKTPDAPVTDRPPSTPPDAPTVAPSQPGSISPTAPLLPPDRVPERAPIDGLDIRVAESFPPQYFLHIKAGLPSGCAKEYTHILSRAGDVITVTVLNSTAKDAICTAIYGSYDLNINLGSGFDSGKTYTVQVID